MSRTIFDPVARRVLLARIDQLAPDTPARWGKFTTPKMVSHLIEAVRMALGDIEVKARSGVLSNPVVRYLVIYWMRWPKGTPTAPELLARVPESWPADLAALKALIERAAANKAGHWELHPAFGNLSPTDWGALIHRHTDHHLTQFGV